VLQARDVSGERMALNRQYLISFLTAVPARGYTAIPARRYAPVFTSGVLGMMRPRQL
jgi:hypothetical protein